jgi:primase-polymerase (primpol)-like protein
MSHSMEQDSFLQPNFDTIPDALKAQPWAVWIAEPRAGRPGKFNKAPRNPVSGHKVGANQPEKFGTYTQAVAAYGTGGYTGIGVLLTGNGIIGVDIDDYKETFTNRPEVKDWVANAVKEGAYCEKSPSGNGLRLFMLGQLDGTGRKSGSLEIYDDVRFLTVTGRQVKPKKGGE